ncbi:uncharacterized protein THITE_2131444 [Thermothielavioides terrestris NRRL 8126]|jgi:hypothetical protein|uniref:Velvet domain-containing protein n=1 Tax=Thermothielavioides terrestris (strain ATCC 38088 / NRRL 8126) TaxID=578455 RepID=G2RD54_THETT|nr:uncharacterized protein THITE_2131444 [Thermothielavioides terrestris NRRL 8126]AEO69889.1 hypothetical protein THITE_2131444 [Thermothielavioides terrestris NRRL 8126]
MAAWTQEEWEMMTEEERNEPIPMFRVRQNMTGPVYRGQWLYPSTIARLEIDPKDAEKARRRLRNNRFIARVQLLTVPDEIDGTDVFLAGDKAARPTLGQHPIPLEDGQPALYLDFEFAHLMVNRTGTFKLRINLFRASSNHQSEKFVAWADGRTFTCWPLVE